MLSLRPTLHRTKLLPLLTICLGVLAGLVLAESFLVSKVNAHFIGHYIHHCTAVK